MAFNIEGDYVLKLTASDGELTGEKTITVHGLPSDGTSNVAPQATATASYTNAYQPKDNAKKLVDGSVVYTNTPAETWNNWGDPFTTKQPWAQLEWSGKVPLKKVNANFWTDGGGVPMAQSWKLQYADDHGDWQDVKLKDGSTYTVNQNADNVVQFADTVVTNKLRIVFPDNAVVGMSEFEAYAVQPDGIEAVSRMVQTGSKPADVTLPSTVSASYNDGTRRDLAVTWPAINESQLAADGSFTLNGTVIGATAGTTANISVKSDANAAEQNGVSNILDSEQTVYRGSKSFTPPSTVTGTYQNGAFNSGLKVTWDEGELNAVKLDTIGTYTVTGTVEGTSKKATLTVTVVADPNNPAEPADKTALDAAISSADGLQESEYTADSWKAFASALAEAKKVSAEPEADQQAVDAAASALTAAQKALVKVSPEPEADKSALRKKVDEAKGLQESEYTADSWKPVVSSLAAAESVLADEGADQQAVDAALNTLTDSIAALVKVSPEPSVDKSALGKKVDEAGALKQTDYTAASWKAFATALADAKNVLANGKATQDEVDAALKALDQAGKALVKAGSQGGSTRPSPTRPATPGSALSKTGASVMVVAGGCLLAAVAAGAIAILRKRGIQGFHTAHKD